MDSDDNLHHHCLDDVACPLTCHIIFILLKCCVFMLLLSSVLVVLSIWLVTWHCHIVVIVEVVKWLQEVVVTGGSGETKRG